MRPPTGGTSLYSTYSQYPLSIFVPCAAMPCHRRGTLTTMLDRHITKGFVAERQVQAPLLYMYALFLPEMAKAQADQSDRRHIKGQDCHLVLLQTKQLCGWQTPNCTTQLLAIPSAGLMFGAFKQHIFILQIQSPPHFLRVLVISFSALAGLEMMKPTISKVLWCKQKKPRIVISNALYRHGSFACCTVLGHLNILSQTCFRFQIGSFTTYLKACQC